MDSPPAADNPAGCRYHHSGRTKNVQKLNQALPSLNSRCLPQFFQLMKTGSALSDVRKQVSELSAVRRLLNEFPQDFSSWTVDALRIGKVFVQDSVKCVEQ